MENHNEDQFSSTGKEGELPKDLQATQEEVKAFFKQDLGKIFKTFIFEPLDGPHHILSNRSEKSYFHSLILIVTTAVLTFIFVFLSVGKMVRSMMGFGDYIALLLAPALFLILISLIAFGAKTIFGKGDLKSELLTGGLCGIPFTLLMAFAFIITILFDGNSMISLASGRLPTAGLPIFILFLYPFLMLFNVVQQSFKASGMKGAIGWYLSPAVIVLAGWLTSKIMDAIFG